MFTLKLNGVVRVAIPNVLLSFETLKAYESKNRFQTKFYMYSFTNLISWTFLKNEE